MAKEDRVKPKEKGVRAIILLPILATLAGGFIYLATRKAEAAPTPTPSPIVVPTAPTVDELVEEIGQAESLAELNIYYQLISEMFIKREISYLDYKRLYDAYYARWEELTGVTA